MGLNSLGNRSRRVLLIIVIVSVLYCYHLAIFFLYSDLKFIVFGTKMKKYFIVISIYLILICIFVILEYIIYDDLRIILNLFMHYTGPVIMCLCCIFFNFLPECGLHRYYFLLFIELLTYLDYRMIFNIFCDLCSSINFGFSLILRNRILLRELYNFSDCFIFRCKNYDDFVRNG